MKINNKYSLKRTAAHFLIRAYLKQSVSLLSALTIFAMNLIMNTKTFYICTHKNKITNNKIARMRYYGQGQG